MAKSSVATEFAVDAVGIHIAEVEKYTNPIHPTKLAFGAICVTDALEGDKTAPSGNSQPQSRSEKEDRKPFNPFVEEFF